MFAICAHQVRLKPRIAEKHGFIKVLTVKVCAKARIGRRGGIKNYVLVPISRKRLSRGIFLIDQRNFVRLLMSYGEKCAF